MQYIVSKSFPNIHSNILSSGKVCPHRKPQYLDRFKRGNLTRLWPDCIAAVYSQNRKPATARKASEIKSPKVEEEAAVFSAHFRCVRIRRS